ncbi:chromophore lyase CpcT/CpeT [Egbenema bharatensis]|uniref:chromophore lyase CpcT/CpeT n=1 Tax=Egbenema bharatensis TaxID=3463334 RepID=UPI003A85F372
MEIGLETLNQLVSWLAGEFENQAQALDQPAWFVHLRLWHRPLPFLIDGYPALFAEQANALYLDKPYRQRVVTFRPTDPPDRLQAQYYACKQPDRWQGAGANPDRLQSLTLEDLELLPGCRLTVMRQDDWFKADPVPDTQCCFQYQGETRQVILGFEVSADTFLSYDRGVDPKTEQALWGAIMGAYRFQKRQNFGVELV